MSNPYLNPSLSEGYILTPTRIEVIKLDRTGKYVLKLPHASRNKDRKLNQNKHQPKFGPKSWKQRSPKHFWKGGKQEMEKLIKYVKEIGFFEKKK
jgi:hypothetical protein